MLRRAVKFASRPLRVAAKGGSGNFMIAVHPITRWPRFFSVPRICSAFLRFLWALPAPYGVITHPIKQQHGIDQALHCQKFRIIDRRIRCVWSPSVDWKPRSSCQDGARAAIVPYRCSIARSGATKSFLSPAARVYVPDYRHPIRRCCDLNIRYLLQTERTRELQYVRLKTLLFFFQAVAHFRNDPGAIDKSVRSIFMSDCRAT